MLQVTPKSRSQNAGVDAIIIDTAHGHTQGVVKCVERSKSNFHK
jgi:hypothetical protein